MPNLIDLNSQLAAFTEALDRVSDKIADVKNDQQVKAALIRQYEELNRQKIKIENQIKELEQSKIMG
jgi:cell division protein FtsB